MMFILLGVFFLGCEFSSPPSPSVNSSADFQSSTAGILLHSENIRHLFISDRLGGLNTERDALAESWLLLGSDPRFSLLSKEGHATALLFDESKALKMNRVVYSMMSAHLVNLMQSAPVLQEGFQIFECPMVEDYPFWVQPNGEMENPYMGLEMLNCGVSTEWESKPIKIDEKIAYHTCPMHPSIQNKGEGHCPICSMSLVPVSTVDLDSGSVLIDGRRRQAIGLSFGAVERGEILSSFVLYGQIHPDERFTHTLSLRFEGWVERTHIHTIGEKVSKGDLLFEMYSPEVLTAQQELLISSELRQISRRKLSLLGLSKSWIQRVIDSGRAQEFIPIRAPIDGTILKAAVQDGVALGAGDPALSIGDLHHVWLDVETYPTKPLIGEDGSDVEVWIDNQPIQASILHTLPYQSENQTQQRRLAIEWDTPLAQIGEVVAVRQQTIHTNVLRVPTDAVIYTGERRIVFVDIGDNRLQPRDIVIGVRTSDWIEVKSGLEEGEVVVNSGVFLVASESRIQSATTFWAGASYAGE